MKNKRVVKGVLAGAVVGIAAGLLFGTKTGKQTRQALGAKSKVAKSKASGYFSAMRKKTLGDPEANSVSDPSQENPVSN